jgi:hypothetical protein
VTMKTVVFWVVTRRSSERANVSEVPTASIFRVKE